MVILHEDSIYAFEEPMKNKSDEEMQRAYSANITRINKAKLTVKKHIFERLITGSSRNALTKQSRSHHQSIQTASHLSVCGLRSIVSNGTLGQTIATS